MRRPLLFAALLPVLMVLVALVAGCAHSSSSATSGAAVVTRDVDGDTVDVRIAGHEEPIRFLGIDTPETHDPRRPVECYGAEASARTAHLLPPGTHVQLVRDVEARDKYGRLLAYIYRSSDHLFVNLSLATDGFATTLDIPPNDAHARQFAIVVSRARAAGTGLWGTCGGPDTPAT